MKARRAKAGFTLIELLVAIALGVLILGIVAVVFAKTSDVFNDATARIEALQNARVAIEWLERDLEQAFTDPAGRCFIGVTDASAVTGEWAAVADATTMPGLWFTTTSEGDSGGKVVYYVATALAAFEPTAYRLMRAADTDLTRLDVNATLPGPIPNPNYGRPAPAGASMIAYGVRSMAIRYFYQTESFRTTLDPLTVPPSWRGGSWTDSWNAVTNKQYPTAVMVRVEVIDRKGRLAKPGKSAIMLERVVRVGANHISD